MLEQSKPELAKLIARINVGFQADQPMYQNIYQHDLLTFDIHPDDISLLNALHQDVTWHCTGKDVGYMSLHEKMQWLSQTHAFSSRMIDAESFRRWDRLVCFLNDASV